MQLMENPRFQKEYREFRSAVEKIVDDKQRAECQQLLKKMLREAGLIDQKHGELTVTPRIDDSVGEHRRTLFELRKQLANRLTKFKKQEAKQ